MGSARSKKYIFMLAEILAFSLVSGVFLYSTALIPGFTKLYSKWVQYRFQTDALLQGKLALSSRPFGLPWDFIWTEHGMQQAWGLGVPFLRFPFEWMAKVCGFGAFPDRITFLFYLILMILVLNSSLRMVLATVGVEPRSAFGLLLRWYLISWILFFPLIIELAERDMIRTETILYGWIYCLLIISLFWNYLCKFKDYLFIILCFVSGLAWLIRPTLIFYGIAFTTVAGISAFQISRNHGLIVKGVSAFCTGVILDLWLNYLRFGSLFEFGYSRVMETNTAVNYAMLFGYPFRHEPFLSASKELIGALFSLNLWRSHTYRDRLYSFVTFDISHLVILVLGVILFFFLTFRWRWFCQNMSERSFRIIYSSLFAGILCFLSLFMFYLRSPALIDRYLADFIAAIGVIFIAQVLFCVFWLKEFKEIILLLFMVMGVVFYFNNALPKPYSWRDLGLTTNQEGVKSLVRSFHQDILLQPELPETFYCHHVYTARGLRFQFSGWDIVSDCSVYVSTTVFLPSQRCIKLNYTTSNPVEWSMVQVKRNLMSLKSVENRITKETFGKAPKLQMTQRFCSDTFPPKTVALYTIGWVLPDKLGEYKLPVTLNWVSVSDKEMPSLNVGKSMLTKTLRIKKGNPFPL